MDPIQQPIPQANEFSPVPASPAGVPGIPPTQEETGMSQDDMKSRLQEVMAKLQGKYQAFDESKFNAENDAAKMKSDALSELFTMLESKGIDPNNPDELQNFLDGIKGRNPELYQQIVTAITAIIGSEESMNPNAGNLEAQTNNMNINNDNQPAQNI